MLGKITRSLLSTVVAGPKDFSIVDTAQPGLELRVRASGHMSWCFRYSIHGGQQQRLRLGRYPGVSVGLARELALIAAADVAKGVDVCARRKEMRLTAANQRVSTLGKFIQNQYGPWAKANLETGAFCVKRLKCDFASFLDKPLMGINRALIEKWRTERKEAGAQNGTINATLQRLHAALSRAVKWETIPSHPFAGLEPLKADRTGRVRFLDDEEEARLRTALIAREQERRHERQRYIEHCLARSRRVLPQRSQKYTDHIQPIVLLALNTGLRRKEIFKLRWRDVNLGTRWLTVVGRTAKNKQTRRVPLNLEAWEVLKTWHDQASSVEQAGYIFPGKNSKCLTTITTAWRGLRARASLSDFRFHDLRHHFASRLTQAGVDLNVIRELLGHADLDMVLRYAHLAPTGLALAVEKVARVVLSSARAA